MRWMLTATLAAALTGPLASQDKPKDQPPERRVLRLEVDGGRASLLRPTLRFQPVLQRRARLGVLVSLEAKETDSLGAFIQSVTPGGPAAKAGLRSGDIITRLDGKSLLTQSGRAVDEDESLPGVRLIELAAKLEPNDTIPVEYLRGDARRTATVVTGNEAVWTYEVPNFRGSLELRGVRPFRFDSAPGRGFLEVPEARGFSLLLGGGLSDLELAPLNPDLGWYFGATEGILVVRARRSGSLGLKPGDVVLSVDGRKPSSPGSLLRILRSYDAGETFKLEILRQKRRETVTSKLESRPDLEE